MAKSSDIKEAIAAKLTALVPATLGQVIVDNLKQSFENVDIAKYPCAIIGSPAFGNDYLNTHENLRTYTFEIIVLQKAENFSSSEDIEELTEALIAAFDEDHTLGGIADGGVEPSISEPAAVGSADTSFVALVITIVARASISVSS